MREFLIEARAALWRVVLSAVFIGWLVAALAELGK